METRRTRDKVPGLKVDDGLPLWQPIAPWTTESVFYDGAFFESLFKDIRECVVSVELESYIFRHDSVGVECVKALAEAARRGVAVRIIVDGIGSQGWERSFGQELAAAGVRFKIFHQLPWERRDWSAASLLRIQRFIDTLNRLNHRNHRKLCIIDKKIAWVGSQNMNSDHLAASSGGGNWRDTAARVEGPGVAELSEAFERNWNRKGTLLRKPRRASTEATGAVILNETRRQRRRNFRKLVRRFYAADKRIWVTNSYFIPHRRLLLALHHAAERGVDVRIIVPQRSDVTIIPWVTAAFYQGLIRAGVRVYEYVPRMLHAKSMIVDDWFLVGSSNLDLRSLLHNLEVDVVLSTTDSEISLNEQFQRDLGESKLVTWARLRARPFWERWLGSIALVFRSLL